MVDTATYGVVCLITCDAHAPIARTSGQYVEEPTYEGFCGFPGTLWVDNHCVLDDSGRSEHAMPATSGLIELR